MSASEQLAQLAEKTWQNTLSSYPELATILGDGRGNHTLTDNSNDARLERLTETKAFLAELDAIDSDQLTEDEKITADILRIGYESSIEGEPFNFHLWDIDQLNGIQVGFPTLVQNFHPKKTNKDWRDLISRYHAVKAKIDNLILYLKEGAEKGYSAPRIAVERVISQLDGLLEKQGEDSIFVKILEQLEDSIDDQDSIRADLKEAAKSSVLPAFEAFRETLKTVCLPIARDNTGLWENPQGDASYAYMVKSHLGKAMDPKDVHQIGIEQLASIHAEMEVIAQEFGMTRVQYAQKLTEEEDNFHDSKEALVEEYQALITKAYEAIPPLFGRLPKVGCTARSIEEFREQDAPAGFYNPPPEDGSRPGLFYANTYKPETRLRSNMACLTYHEAVPGHHLQIALAMELDLPTIRKHGRFTAYVEGWALYTERLCDEIGLYEKPRDRFGMLGFQAWRAARLVVDTGLHALKWSRDKAVKYLAEATVLPESEVVNEIDRYLIMPGQALSYKIGEIEIQNRRKEAKEALGDKFDIKEFHDCIIGSGALPLETMNKLIYNWIDEKKALPA
ncbi:MAG: DUF885 domain-containing protein [Planctomycetota bacterium]|nr:DUF885 domain-containing protein [Planctomycetota bacterium]